MSVRDYGIINFNFGVASFAQTVALIGSTNALTVYVSKNVKIQSTFFVISLICGSISALVIFFCISENRYSTFIDDVNSWRIY